VLSLPSVVNSSQVIAAHLLTAVTALKVMMFVVVVWQPPPTSTATSSRKWVISDADKVRYDDMFEKADTDRDGFVSGAEIKGIFLKSGLAQPVLARIWYERSYCSCLKLITFTSL